MEHTRDSDFLQRLALAAAATLDVKALVGLVIGETTGVMGVDVCSVYLVDAGGDGLMLSATNGLSQAGVGTVRLALGEGITGHAALHRRPTVADDVRRDPRFRWLAGVDQERFVSMCSVPIVSADRLVGVLNVQTDQPHRFGESEVALLGAIAAHVAGALERSALQERLQHQVHELRRSHEIHARFTQLSLGGAGLRAICRAIADHAGAPVGLYDDADVRIAGSDDDALPEALGDADGDGLTVRPLRAGDEVLGSLAVAGPDGGDPVRRRAVEHGATVLALELSRERAAAEAERHLRGDLVEELLTAGREVFVPRADPRDGKLHVHPYPCALRTLSFGLRQPPRGTPEVAEEAIDGTLDAVLVLGLGFDRRGFRLGYGSGYFDRFLAHRPFPAIGLAFAVQLEERLPNEPHDIPMALVVTETEVCRPLPPGAG